MTSHPMFVPGAVYRRRDLHEQFGGQRQGGISTPRQHPMVWVFTGEQGGQYGCQDGFQDDGAFWYTGEGQVGDMKMVRGNAAIRDHLGNSKKLHLFEYVSPGHVQHIGEAAYSGHHLEVAPDRDGTPRRVIVFELVLSPTGSELGRARVPQTSAREPRRMSGRPLEELRQLAIEGPISDATITQRKANSYQRSQAVRVYVLRRAKGKCEGCESSAPFYTADGTPYLEPHHIRRRADGGPDHPRWVVALCPNCHRQVHYERDGDAFNDRLAEKAMTMEAGCGPASASTTVMNSR